MIVTLGRLTMYERCTRINSFLGRRSYRDFMSVSFLQDAAKPTKTAVSKNV